MRCFVIAVSLCVFSGSALADASCTTKGAEKKLAGAALTSFMTKCEQDAAAACDADGKSKKLAGAALDSHMKKCIADAVGDRASLTCKGQAGEKKLAGAALDSFMKKGEQDAAATCDADGESKKLAGGPR